MNRQCHECIEAGFTVVTASNRLGQRLHFEFARRRVQAGITTWETPDLLPLSAWLARTWHEMARFDASGRTLLAPVQARSLWQRIIADSGYGASLLQPAAVAMQASLAWETLHAWRRPPSGIEPFVNEDVRAFQSWARAYLAECDAGGWQDPALLAEELRAAAQGRAFAAPRALALAGFDAPAPDLLALLETLHLRGASVVRISPEARNRTVEAHGFADRRAEIGAAACWVRNLLEKAPGSTIGIVAPDLAEVRNAVEIEFDDVLLPGALLDPPQAAARPWTIALGRPLGDYPIVAAALLMLRVAQDRLTLPEIGSLMRSPFLGDAGTEAVQRAAFEAHLRRQGDARHGVRSLLESGAGFSSTGGGCALLLKRLRACVELLQSLPRTQSSAHWAETFSRLLATLGWPGPRTPVSDEYQCLQAWREALGEFASLDRILRPMNYPAGLAEFMRVVAQHHFQPRTGEAPVQVLGISGAADMQFDYLWIMGLEEETWPCKAQPNPFIPIRLQREHAMPHASPEVELAHARAVTKMLVRSAAHVVFSYPQNDGDRPLRPSALIRDYLRNTAGPDLRCPAGYTAQIHAARTVESVMDDVAPAPPAGRLHRGGAALFRDQAACPFRAFARHRLQARGLDEVDAGISARDRGTLVHRVLQAVWQRLRDHAGLRSVTDSELGAMIESAVDSALAVLRRRRPGSLTPRFAGLERDRLRRITRDWLATERQRPPFSVEACEREREFDFAGLRLSIRIDRVDRLADGSKALLDYKTGEARLAAWIGERPDEPQLPLYVVTEGGAVAVAAFARVEPGAYGFVGLTADTNILPGVESVSASRQFRQFGSWEHLLAHWRSVLERLAGEFQSGDARVAPKGARACRHCDLHPLCRVHELAAVPAEETDE